MYVKYKGKLWTSGFVIAELLLVCRRFNLDSEKIVVSIYRIIEVRDLDERVALLAAHYIQEKNINVFDALHASYSQYDSIISSDHIFDKLGLTRIKIEE